MVEVPMREIIQDETERGSIPPITVETSYKDSHTEIFILKPRRALSISRNIEDAWSGERAIYERELDEFRETLLS